MLNITYGGLISKFFHDLFVKIIEPWVKVETLDGTVGWARLIYLCPAYEKDFELKLQ